MRARSGIDVARLGSAAQRPGVDPRVTVTLAIVKELGFDAAEGLFADVQFQPSGEIETCFIGSPYAGNQFGMYMPLQVDDTVLVAVPSGDPNHGPVVICRMWDAADKPHSDFGNGEVPTDDFVLRVRPGKVLRLTTSGDGGEIRIKAEGSAKVVLESADKVYIGGDSGTQPMTLGQTLKGFLDAAKTWLDTHTHNYVPGTLATVPTSPPIAPSPSVPDVRATKGQVK